MVETTKTNTDQQEGKVLLPFHDLVFLLRRHGFVVRPEDYLEILKVVEKFGYENIENGAPILCPLIATSPEEQERFYKVFEEYKTQSENNEVVTLPQRFKWWINKARWWLAAAAVLLIVVISAFILSRPLKSLDLDFTYNKSSTGDAKFRVGDTIQLDASATFPANNADSGAAQIYWNTGNGFELGAMTVPVVMKKEGNMTIQLKIRSHKYIINDSIKSVSFPVCPQVPIVQFPFDKTSYSIGDELTVVPFYASDKHFRKVAWKINSTTIQPEDANQQLRYRFDSTGTYAISFIGYTNDTTTENASCAYIKTFDDIVINKKTFALNVVNSGESLEIIGPKSIHPLLNWLLLIPALLISVVTFLKWNQARNQKKKKEDPPLFNGQKPPYETPFENKDLKLTVPEFAFNEIMRSFRQKAQDETAFLNIAKSLHRTMHNSGMPELVFTNKMRYTDYVILVDRNLAKSMQVHLFDYLVKLINEETINVERFYYTGNFEHIFNESIPGGMSLKRFAEIYKSYTLIVMGNAHQLVYSAYSILDKNITDVLSEWEHKAVLTPVPYKDWDQKETLISKRFILLPADLQGQLKLIQAIREKQLDHKKYLSSVNQFYETAYYDFYVVEDLKTFLDDDVLLQWLCACAVFHKLRWEIVVEVGKAICSSYNQPEKMNFTNLLKLSRISWMNEGTFPAAIRLELLKQLVPANEVLARETLLLMMRHAETYFGKGYFFEEEKEIQKITSRFLLYAFDPIKNAAYEADQQKFKLLWENDKLWDKPQAVYLENPDKKWPTLINFKGKSTGISQYFQLNNIKASQSARKELWRNGLIATSLLLMLVIIHFIKNKLPDDSLLLIANQSFNSLVTIKLNPRIQCQETDSVLYQQKPGSPIQGELTLKGGKYSFDFNKNYVAEVRIPAKSMSHYNGTLQIKWNNDQPVLATSIISLKNNTIDASLSACTNVLNYSLDIEYNDASRKNEVTGIAEFLKGQGYAGTNIVFVNSNDPSAVHYSKKADKLAADSLAGLLSFQYKNFFNEGLPIVPDSTPVVGSANRLKILINYKSVTTDASGFMPAVLAAFLNEIWKGSTNNRLLTIVNNRLLYYSTGDKKTYGTYRIDDVRKNSNGLYKLITLAGKQYQVFFIKNIQSVSFELSACNNRYDTREQAMTITDGDCDPFNRMTLYYEPDDKKIFLPIRSDENMEQVNQAKMNILSEGLKKPVKNASGTSIEATLYYNTRYSFNTSQLVPAGISQNIPIKGETPFDRSYIQYTTGITTNYTPEECQSKGDEFLAKKDYKNALYWYSKADGLGYEPALMMLAWIYEQDYGYKNLDLSIKYYTRAAQKGNSEAMWRMGYVLFHAMNKASEGVKWLLQSSEAGNVDGMFQLAAIYGYDPGLKDESKAASWFKKAYEGGNKEAKGEYGIFLYEGKGGLKPDKVTGQRLISEAYDETKNALYLNYLKNINVFGAPELLSPRDKDTFNIYPRTTKLTWRAVLGAKSYRVEVQYNRIEVQYNNNSSWQAFKMETVNDTSYSFDFIGAQPGRWRVFAISSDNKESQPSVWREFSYLR